MVRTCRNEGLGQTYSQEVDAGSLGSLEKGFESKDALCRKVALLAFKQSPVGVEADTSVAESLDLLENVQPQTWNGKSV